MAKNAHDPREKTKPVSIMQVIGDKDRSINGSTNPKVTMYSADERIETWRKFIGAAATLSLWNKGTRSLCRMTASQGTRRQAYHGFDGLYSFKER